MMYFFGSLFAIITAIILTVLIATHLPKFVPNWLRITTVVVLYFPFVMEFFEVVAKVYPNPAPGGNPADLFLLLLLFVGWVVSIVSVLFFKRNS